MQGRFKACCAGLCAALASVTGKLITVSYVDVSSDSTVSFAAATVFRATFLGATIFLNGAMWTMFVEAMQALNSAEATVLNLGCNIIFSAAIGWLIFDEKFSVLWWIGATLIVTGIAFIQFTSGDASLKTKKVT